MSSNILLTLKPQIKANLKKRRGRKPKPKNIVVPRALEIDYARMLLKISKYCQAQAKDIVLPESSKYIGDSWLDSLMSAFRETLTRYIMDEAFNLANSIVTAVRKDTDTQLGKHAFSVLGIDLTPFYRGTDIQREIDNQIMANVALINSIPAQYADKVEAAVLTSLQTGSTNEELAAKIKHIGGVTDSRAILIARDQIGKIQAGINKQRQTALNVLTYDYWTALDDKVRPQCEANHGQTFSWDQPPPGGHPGEKIQCRCTAQPNYEDILI